MALPWPFAVQCLVARATGDQGLPAIRYHALDPQGFLLAAWLVQVRKPADVGPAGAFAVMPSMA
jgi:hypothetical protein